MPHLFFNNLLSSIISKSVKLYIYLTFVISFCWRCFLTSNANILRLKDAIHPDEANTPVRRACYLAQLLLSGEVESASLWDRLLGQVRTRADILSDTHSSTLLLQAQGAIADRNAYGCLKLLRQLLPLEARLVALHQE